MRIPKAIFESELTYLRGAINGSHEQESAKILNAFSHYLGRYISNGNEIEPFDLINWVSSITKDVFYYNLLKPRKEELESALEQFDVSIISKEIIWNLTYSTVVKVQKVYQTWARLQIERSAHMRFVFPDRASPRFSKTLIEQKIQDLEAKFFEEAKKSLSWSQIRNIFSEISYFKTHVPQPKRAELVSTYLRFKYTLQELKGQNITTLVNIGNSLHPPLQAILTTNFLQLLETELTSKQQLYLHHPLLGGIAPKIIDLQITRDRKNPANDSKETFEHLIQKGLQYEALTAGIDISMIPLNSFENIDRVIHNISVAKNQALIKFFSVFPFPHEKLTQILEAEDTSEVMARNIREWISDSKEFLERIAVLPLQSQSLAAIPDEIYCFPNLIVLNLSHNSLRALPESISLLPALQVIHLEGNHIRLLPGSFKQLPWNRTLAILGTSIILFPDPERSTHI